MKVCLLSFSLASLLFTVSAKADAPKWRTLFDGETLDDWTVLLENDELGNDPHEYVQIRDNAIHMYANIDPSERVPFGIIAHEDTFSHFHLSFEYRWLEKKFAPRKHAIRDAGLLFHVGKLDKIWPASIEYQIQEGDTGDIVFLDAVGLTWHSPNPDQAPEGQGTPGMLPEFGGIPHDYAGETFAYIGRFPVLDRLEGWNRVEVIVHGDSRAEYIVNGETVARVRHLQTPDGTPLREGKIALQLEGAEIQYRNVRIQEIEVPLRPDRAVVSLSAVRGHRAKPARLTIHNPSDSEVPASLTVIGKDKEAFTIETSTDSIPAEGDLPITVTFDPIRGSGEYSAGLQIGEGVTGTFILLKGVSQNAFEGGNEPPLQRIVHALGVPLDVGGRELHLGTEAATIGDSRDFTHFQAATDGKITITPLARYSPPGSVPFGIVAEGDEEPREIGRLADSTEEVPDAHQSIFPPLDSGNPSVSFDAPETAFSVYMIGHRYTSSTDSNRPTDATITHTARVYPISYFQGRRLKNAYLIGFEEASNGDYQDALFLIENVQEANK